MDDSENIDELCKEFSNYVLDISASMELER